MARREPTRRGPHLNSEADRTLDPDVALTQLPLSCAEIAAELGRNPVSVYRAIIRLKIQATIQTAAGYKFYSRECLEILRHGMRAQNGRKVTSAAVTS